VPFVLLFVCTGNVCRSPMAELLARAWADPRADLALSSAGLGALVGSGIDRSSASVLGQLGIDPTRHRARQFRPELAAGADLVLTAETGQRDVVIAEVPSAYRRTFTMKEFARLARQATATVPREVVAELAWRRGDEGPVPDHADDVADPFRAPISEARAAAQEIAAAVQVTLRVLGFAAGALAPTGAEPVASRRPSPRPRPRPRFQPR
jgi:protein-tyrosine phosphatase